jgi:hypothetical protein
MLTPPVARQGYGAAGRVDRQQTAFVAPQELKDFYVETHPLRLWRHKTFAKDTYLGLEQMQLRVTERTECGGLVKGNLGKRFGAKREEVREWKIPYS